MVTYGDIEGLRTVTDAKKRRLSKERASLMTRREQSKTVLQGLARAYEELKARLAD